MPDLTFTRSIAIAAPVASLREWHFRPGAFARLTPPWEDARVLEMPSPLVDGARAVIEVRIGPLRRLWVAEHELTDSGFIDRQNKGPFALWEHDHRFEAVDDRTSRLTDTIRYRLPFGVIGRIFGRHVVEKKLDRLFRYRHAVTAADLGAKDSTMPPGWKSDIITLTELPEAREGKIDASFFPPVSVDRLASWEREHGFAIPMEIRSFLLQSDGLEACRGELWPVLPFAQWEIIDDACASAHPWIRFGEGREHRYLLSLGHSPSIYRHETFGSDEVFFASGFRSYLEKVFRDEA